VDIWGCPQAKGLGKLRMWILDSRQVLIADSLQKKLKAKNVIGGILWGGKGAGTGLYEDF